MREYCYNAIIEKFSSMVDDFFNFKKERGGMERCSGYLTNYIR